jgi:pimeloyl-ACP methyl ester carboxylesterase
MTQTAEIAIRAGLMDQRKTMKAPHPLLLMAEGRAFAELAAFYAATPWLSTLPKGDGHPVLVLPGFMANDPTTAPLRRFLIGRGYQAFGWGMGRNLGLRPGVLDGMLARFDELSARYGQKISLIGWSLGGVFVRELAKIRSSKVRQVITLGSPFAGHPRATNAWRVYQWVARHDIDQHPWREHLATPPPVPTTSIYSKTDGVVSWQCSLNKPGDFVENIEVPGSHCGLGHNPLAVYAIADRLAQPEGAWAPFERAGLRRAFFRQASHG